MALAVGARLEGDVTVMKGDVTALACPKRRHNRRALDDTRPMLVGLDGLKGAVKGPSWTCSTIRRSSAADPIRSDT